MIDNKSKFVAKESNTLEVIISGWKVLKNHKLKFKNYKLIIKNKNEDNQSKGRKY